ncbi:MAG: hypothetical protein HY360_22485, partial [Verrucomicrobia bacterium]|nr:hypothetical protein [Verrucomicrobiota bacterium]
MSTVEEIESAIQTLPATEVKTLREWLEDYLEDQMEFTDEFKESVSYCASYELFSVLSLPPLPFLSRFDFRDDQLGWSLIKII